MARLSKEQFLLANCQFVVDMSDETYQRYVADSDKTIDWESIEQVVSERLLLSRCVG